MAIKPVLKKILEEEEKSSVSNSFGGTKCNGRTPSYNIAGITKLLSEECNNNQNDELALLWLALAHLVFCCLDYLTSIGTWFLVLM